MRSFFFKKGHETYNVKFAELRYIIGTRAKKKHREQVGCAPSCPGLFFLLPVLLSTCSTTPWGIVIISRARTLLTQLSLQRRSLLDLLFAFTRHEYTWHVQSDCSSRPPKTCQMDGGITYSVWSTWSELDPRRTNRNLYGVVRSLDQNAAPSYPIIELERLELGPRLCQKQR